MAVTLEQALGTDAVLALRDWLVATYPLDDPRAGRDALGMKRLPPVKHSRPTFHEIALCRFYACEYRNGSRRWWRVMDRETDACALWAPPGSQRPMRQEGFISYDEACAVIDKLTDFYP